MRVEYNAPKVTQKKENMMNLMCFLSPVKFDYNRMLRTNSTERILDNLED